MVVDLKESAKAFGFNHLAILVGNNGLTIVDKAREFNVKDCNNRQINGLILQAGKVVWWGNCVEVFPNE